MDYQMEIMTFFQYSLKSQLGFEKFKTLSYCVKCLIKCEQVNFHTQCCICVFGINEPLLRCEMQRDNEKEKKKKKKKRQTDEVIEDRQSEKRRRVPPTGRTEHNTQIYIHLNIFTCPLPHFRHISPKFSLTCLVSLRTFYIYIYI